MFHGRLAFGGTHPLDFWESVLRNTNFPIGTRVTELTLPGPREAPVPRPAPRGVSGVRVTEHPFLRPRETTIQGHGPVSLT